MVDGKSQHIFGEDAEGGGCSSFAVTGTNGICCGTVAGVLVSYRTICKVYEV